MCPQWPSDFFHKQTNKHVKFDFQKKKAAVKEEPAKPVESKPAVQGLCRLVEKLPYLFKLTEVLKDCLN